MEEKIKELLEEEIKTEIEALSTLDSGSKEKSVAIDDLVKLYELKIKETENELDYNEKCQKRISDSETYTHDERLKWGQLSEQAKDRYFRLGAEAAGIILPLMFYAIWMRKGFKFEENGTFTSTTFKGLINRFKPTKK